MEILLFTRIFRIHFFYLFLVIWLHIVENNDICSTDARLTSSPYVDYFISAYCSYFLSSSFFSTFNKSAVFAISRFFHAVS